MHVRWVRARNDAMAGLHQECNHRRIHAPTGLLLEVSLSQALALLLLFSVEHVSSPVLLLFAPSICISNSHPSPDLRGFLSGWMPTRLKRVHTGAAIWSLLWPTPRMRHAKLHVTSSTVMVSASRTISSHPIRSICATSRI